ncbi:uncharacterized protein LOC129248655 [Anastrepha obliqua]|uniref:uncharacterized protein LOC129248655 n=1 Tax=Anastrepha obliqua TaxID=95512 RepID=UPI002409F37B|nr:uncharacterized protein LOC129248655 [Anastrepha obliqua]
MLVRQYPCCFFTPNKQRHRYVEPDPLFAPFHRCKPGSKGSIIYDLYKTPGISERMIKSLLLSDCPEKKCKCGDAWNGQDPLGSIPFTKDLTEEALVTEKDSQQQLLMERLGFFEDGTFMSEEEKMREWLKELNKIYNDYNNNYISIKHRKGKRRRNSTYLDYPLFYTDSKTNYINNNLKKGEPQGRADSLVSYGARLSARSRLGDSEWRESKDFGAWYARWRENNEFPLELSQDLKEDMEKLIYRLRSSKGAGDRQSLKTLLYYPPYVAGQENVWKTLSPDFGAADLRDKLQQLGHQTEFSMWRMLALDCIIKGQPIPYHLYDSKLLRELRADLQELLAKISTQNEEEMIRSKL